MITQAMMQAPDQIEAVEQHAAVYRVYNGVLHTCTMAAIGLPPKQAVDAALRKRVGAKHALPGSVCTMCAC